MTTMIDHPTWLDAPSEQLAALAVDSKRDTIRGYVVAELGPFKTGRGEFDQQSLETIVELMENTTGGLRSRFRHPNLSNDGLGKVLGRAINPRLEDGKVRADLVMNPTAMKTPPDGGRPLGEYVMELAETDPGLLSSSLVLQVEEEFREDSEGNRMTDGDGRMLPPIWRPVELIASDVVDIGDAVNDFLSADQLEGLPDQVVRGVTQYIDKQFEGQDRLTIETRCESFLQRYLDNRFGPEIVPTPTETQTMSDNTPAVSKEQFDELSNTVGKLAESVQSLAGTVAEDHKARQEAAAQSELHKQILARCTAIGKAELADKFISEGLSLEEATTRLFAEMSGTRPPATGNLDPDPQQLSDEDKLKKQYHENKAVHDILGVTEEEFLATEGKIRQSGSVCEMVL